MLRFEEAGKTQFKIMMGGNEKPLETIQYNLVRSDMKDKQKLKWRLLQGQFRNRKGDENVETIANIVAEWALNNCLLLLQQNCKDIKPDSSKGSALFWGLVLTSLYWANADTITNYSVLNENYALFWDLCCQQIRWRSNRTFPFLDREKSRIRNAMFFIPYAPYFENENITKEILGKVYQQIPEDYDECFLSGMTIHAGKFENSTYMVFSDLPDAEKSDYLRQNQAFSIYDFGNVANDFNGMSENIPTKQILYDDLMRQRTERKTSLDSLWQQRFQQNRQPSPPPPPPRLENVSPESLPSIQYELVNRLVQKGLDEYQERERQLLLTPPKPRRAQRQAEELRNVQPEQLVLPLQQPQELSSDKGESSGEEPQTFLNWQKVKKGLSTTGEIMTGTVGAIGSALISPFRSNPEEKQEAAFWNDLKNTGGRNSSIPQEFRLAIQTLLNLNPPSPNIKSIRTLQREAASVATTNRNATNAIRQPSTEQTRAQAQALAQQAQHEQQQNQLYHIQQRCAGILKQIQGIGLNLSRESIVVSPFVSNDKKK